MAFNPYNTPMNPAQLDPTGGRMRRNQIDGVQPNQDPRLNPLQYQVGQDALPQSQVPQFDIGGILRGDFSSMGTGMNTVLANRAAKARLKNRMDLGQFNAGLAARGFDQDMSVRQFNTGSAEKEATLANNTLEARMNALQKLTGLYE